jgi:hypothetical protein
MHKNAEYQTDANHIPVAAAGSHKHKKRAHIGTLFVLLRLHILASSDIQIRSLLFRLVQTGLQFQS